MASHVPRTKPIKSAEGGQIKKSDGQTIDESNHLAKDHERLISFPMTS
jgi:hypothetical protein